MICTAARYIHGIEGTAGRGSDLTQEHVVNPTDLLLALISAVPT